MADGIEQGNGHANGKTDEAALARELGIPLPATNERPTERLTVGASRTHRVGTESFRSDRNGEIKIQATTRVVNGFMGYLMNVCGRAGDQLLPNDLVRLQQVMAILEEANAEKTART